MKEKEKYEYEVIECNDCDGNGKIKVNYNCDECNIYNTCNTCNGKGILKIRKTNTTKK